VATNPIYFVRETFSNLWRNVALTVAAVLTVAVTLALAGTAVLVSRGADRATSQFQDGVEFIIFMNPDVSPDQDESIRAALDSSPQIERWTYVDQQATYQEFRALFSEQPELYEVLTPEDLPPSFRVVPTDVEAEAVDDLAGQFSDRPGVKRVVTASEAIRFIDDFSSRVTVVLLVASLVLVLVSALLILITVFTAIGARRREIEVMKLVGATNWFIRIPFLLEGLFHGLIGAIVAYPALLAVDRYVLRFFQRSEDVLLFQSFAVTNAEIVQTQLLLIAVGAALGVVGSAFAVGRYLDV
jgi:cell division transport system permease protein